MTCYLRVTSNADGCRDNLVNLHMLRMVDYDTKTSKKDTGVCDVEKWNQITKKTNGRDCINVKVVLPSFFHLCFAHFLIIFSLLMYYAWLRPSLCSLNLSVQFVYALLSTTYLLLGNTTYPRLKPNFLTNVVLSLVSETGITQLGPGGFDNGPTQD